MENVETRTPPDLAVWGRCSVVRRIRERGGGRRTGGIERHGHTGGKLKQILEIMQLGLLMANAVLQCGHMMANRDCFRGERQDYKTPRGEKRKGWVYLCHLAIKRDYVHGLKEWSDLRPLRKVSGGREGWRGREMLNASNHRLGGQFVGGVQTPGHLFPFPFTLAWTLDTPPFHNMGGLSLFDTL